MQQGQASFPRRALLAVSVGTCLSLMGDASLYAVLPTHAADAGVSVASVGALLSANRFIRLLLMARAVWSTTGGVGVACLCPLCSSGRSQPRSTG